MQRLAEMQIPIDTLKNFYLTHHHSDHMMDIPAMMNIAWATGMKGPVPMFAPKPIQQTLKAAIEVFSEDYRFRGAGGRYDPIQNLFVAKTVKKADKIHQPVVIFEDDTVKVSAIKVPHSKFDLALGLRFDNAERSIALSGDTRISENIVTLAKGADILVHEAIYWPGIEKMLLERGNGTIPKSQEDYFRNEHTTAEDAGKIASEAGVKTLVLNHLISGPDAVTDAQWITNAKQYFNGEVIVARDRMIL